MTTTPWLRTERHGGVAQVSLGGAWVLSEMRELDARLRSYQVEMVHDIVVDCSALERLDTAGAWLIVRGKREMERRGARVEIQAMPAAFAPLFEIIVKDSCNPPVELPGPNTFTAFLERVGQGLVKALGQGVSLVEFLGMVSTQTVATILQPRRLRVISVVRQMEETGVNALPILGLLSFLIGIVFAYQGADQLRRFGAEIFTVNLLGISILREVGGLIAAIIVAGRSGSAFTAQIGTMKVNEEIDAIETLGMNPVEVLVLPRILALVITLPLLTFYANLMGLVGGAFMSYIDLGITIPVFLRQLQGAIGGWTLWIGLIKAPVFAFVIALVGCFEGLRVERNADSVGRLTTQSVVESVFLVIVADAAFSILFSFLGI